MRKILLSATVLASFNMSAFAVNIDGSTLTPAVAATLTQDQCATLVGPSNIPVVVIPALPNVCVNNIGLQFSNVQLAALTAEQITSLSFDWLRAAGQARQVILLTKASSAAVFRILSLNKLTNNQIAMVTPAQLQGLTAQQFGLLSKTYLQAMTDTQMQALRSDQISVAFDKWTDPQMRNLTTAQISGLPASQTSGLLSYFRSWTPEQVQALTPAQLATIPQAFSYPWFNQVFANFSFVQKSTLTNQAVVQMAKSIEVQKVPVESISTLTDQTVVQMAQNNTLKNLSNAQLAALPVSAIKQLKIMNLLGVLSDAQNNVLPSTDLTLTATLDRSCASVDMTLDNVIAAYSTQATQPANQQDGYTGIALNNSGIFAVPYNATYVYFNRNSALDRMPTNINYYGVINTVFAVQAGGTYAITCRTSAHGPAK